MSLKIIAIEGVDGVGKSTFGNALVTSFPFENVCFIKTPFGVFDRLCSAARIEGMFGSFAAYMLGNEAIQKEFSSKDWIILDRYLLSTVVYHSAIFEQLKDNAQLIKLTGALEPVITVYLEADTTIVDERIQSRKQDSNHAYSSIHLCERFEYYLSDPFMQPWIGNLVRLHSETFHDQVNGVQKIIKVCQDLLS